MSTGRLSFHVRLFRVLWPLMLLAGSGVILSDATGWSGLNILNIGVAAVLVVLAIRAATGGVIVEGQTLIVRNLWLTRRVSLDDVTSIGLLRAWWTCGVSGLAIVRRAGRPIISSNLTLSFRPSANREVREAQRALQELLKRHEAAQ
jgi:hypothetical protein